MFTQKCIKGQLTAALAGSTMLVAVAAQADQVFLDDLIVEGSICAGLDCNNGESFGFDTIRMKENNLRIHFDDTSTTASFPGNDWRIIANDTSNGGTNHLSIEDSTAGRSPFRVEAGASANALVVEADSDIGIGTLNPVVELHVVDGDSPTLRLEQNGSSGFTPQTYDLVSNEANFFIRDVTNGSQLPFRIKPGADSDALFIAANNKVGMGTDSPAEDLHIVSKDGANRVAIELDSAANDNDLRLVWNGTQMRISGENEPQIAMTLTPTGNLTIAGHLVSTGGGGACTVADPCDAVFDPEVYTVPSIEEHAAEMWANQFLPAVGPTGPDTPINMTEKMLRMLNELEHAHIYIEQLHDRIVVLEANATRLQ
ncbi:MAG: hypothetical protein VX083_20270 [Pseudomonadota bacterium]|nr:hypothetical protein [Pseudomonadota bacterium]